MEIRDYFKAKRRWLPAMVAVPLLAAAGTVGYVALQPAEVTAEVRGFVPQSLNTSDSQIGLYIARLNEALRLDEVQTQIDESGNLEEGQLSSITVARAGQSDQFSLVLVTTAPVEAAVPAAESAVKVGTAFVARQALQGAEANTQLAKADFDRAQSAMFAYQDEIGDLDPNVTYANVSRELLNPSATTDVARLTARQAELVGQVRRYNELRAAFQTTSGTLGSAQAQSNGHSAEIMTAESGGQILFSRVDDEAVPGMRFLEPAGLALVLGLLVVLGMSVLPDLLRRKQNPSPSGAGDGVAPVDPPTSRIDVQDPAATQRPGMAGPNGAPVSRSGSMHGARD